MVQAAFSAKTALLAQQNRLNVIANNMSNLDTAGFKSSRVDFKDTLYNTIKRTEEMEDNANLQLGSGVMVGATSLSMENGVPVGTDAPLDFCLSGAGFFTLKGADGAKLYTRDGTFAVSNVNGTRYLVNAQGLFVLDKSGNSISLPAEGKAEQLVCNEKGELFINGSKTPFATLGVSEFPNPGGLESVGGNCFVETAASGAAKSSDKATVLQGFYESSNVDLALEMTRLIRAQRAFSFAARALTTADEMDAMANNLRT
ncbi:MAG: flagellar hook-basal body protein [Clostridiaceae bacterium]|nr:flagellar hook-basal body protein [Eubacteriales bacterium]